MTGELAYFNFGSVRSFPRERVWKGRRYLGGITITYAPNGTVISKRVKINMEVIWE